MARRKSNAWSKGIKKLHTATVVIAALCLVIGAVAGALFCIRRSGEDRFVLKGETQFSFDAGETHTYAEEGVEAICFGRDVSDKLHVETDLQKDAEGNYIIPAEEGVYTITYTVDCLKFGENAPNGVIKRIRIFTVAASEEDGRGEGIEEVAG